MEKADIDRSHSQSVVTSDGEVYSSLFKNNFSVMLLVDPDTLNIIDANQAAVSFYGWSHKELINKRITDINIVEEEKLFQRAQSVKGRKNGHFFVSHRMANGAIRDVEVHTTATVLNGKQLHFSIIHDISERKKADENLILSKQKLELHFLQTPLGVIEWDLEFKIRSWNPAAEKIFGYTKQEILGKHASLLLPKEDRARIENVWKTFLVQKGGTRNTNMNMTQNGDIIFCEWFNTPIVDACGNTIAVFSLVQDVTRFREAKVLVQGERDRFKRLINDSTDILYIVNKDYTIEFQNVPSQRKFGNLKGRKCFKSFFEKDEPCEFCMMLDTLNRNSINNFEADTKNNKSYDVFFSPFQEAEADTKTVVIFRDITQKKNIQAETARVSHLASLGELAAGVAHEINNPVTGIISLAEVLTDRFHKLGGDKRIPEMIISEGERISKIVKNLLSFARDKKDEPSTVRLNEILQLSIELMERQVLKDGIHLSVNLAHQNQTVKARPQELQQVFINLISNARYAINQKYQFPHKNKIFKINCESVTINGKPYARIIFFDRGIGIPKDCLDRITDPFFSTKPSGEGTGLGLSISHGIIESHGGRLWFNSQEGEYTKVMVDLPLHNDLIANGET